MSETADQKQDAGAARRELILDRAEELFAEHGFHGMSMRELAKATGRSPASFYNYFSSKEEIGRASCRERV